jgi:anti-anti-sigma factor
LAYLPLRMLGVATRARQPVAARRPAETPGPVLPPVPAERRPRPACRLEAEVLDTAAGVEVRLRGHAGVLEVDALDFVLRPLSARRPACVTFELSKLDSISSLGMGLLVAFRRAIVRAGGRVCLAADLQPGVREALDRTGLMRLFEVVGTAEPCVTPAAPEVRDPRTAPRTPGDGDQPKTVCPHEG